MNNEIDSLPDSNKYSQNGEEAIIRNLLVHVDAIRSSTTLVEFGGSRGKDNSNLFALGEAGRRLVLIESNPRRFAELEVAVKPFPTISGVLAHVGYSGLSSRTKNKTLSQILRNVRIEPTDVSVVSIDIDGDDAAVFEGLGFVPDIAIVEYNPTFPADANFRNPKGGAIGNSPSEVARVAKNLGMFLVAATATNLVFMKNQYSSAVKEIKLVETLYDLDLPRFGWGYDGTLVRCSTAGENTTQEIYHNGWNDSFLRQPLPKILRKFGGASRLFRLVYFAMTGLLIQPVSTLRLVYSFLKPNNLKK